MIVLVLAAFLGLIPAAIAKGKGRSFGLWWLYGAAIFIVALPHALIISSRSGSDDDLKRRALETLSQGPLAVANANAEFKADGVIGGVPYRADADGTYIALMGGGTVHFRNRQDLEAGVGHRAA